MDLRLIKCKCKECQSSETPKQAVVASYRDRFKLTDRQAAFVDLAMEGKTVKEICKVLRIAKNTSRWYTGKTYDKIGAGTRLELFLFAERDAREFINSLRNR